MALTPSGCAPCIFGAVSSNILTFPIPIVATVPVVINPHITVVDGTSSTYYVTTTLNGITATSLSSGATGGVTVDLTHSNNLTWTTLGTTLTWPTTYAEYVGFEGAAATAPSQCAQTLSSSNIALPTDAVPASLVYPSGAALPIGLLNYLDGIGLPAQLNGDQLIACAELGATLPVIPPTTPPYTTSNSTSLITSTTTSKITSTLTSSTTILSTTTASASSSTIVSTSTAGVSTSSSVTTETSVVSIKPTVITSTIVSVTSKPTVSTVTQTYTSARVFHTLTGPTVIVDSTSSTTLSPSTSATSTVSATTTPSATSTLSASVSSYPALSLSSSLTNYPSLSPNSTIAPNATGSTTSSATLPFNSSGNMMSTPKGWLMILCASLCGLALYAL